MDNNPVMEFICSGLNIELYKEEIEVLTERVSMAKDYLKITHAHDYATRTYLNYIKTGNEFRIKEIFRMRKNESNEHRFNRQIVFIEDPSVIKRWIMFNLGIGKIPNLSGSVSTILGRIDTDNKTFLRRAV